MDSELFDSYEVDLQQLTGSIGAKLSTEVRELKGGQFVRSPSAHSTTDAVAVEPRKALLRRIENELEEADEIVRRFDRI